MWGVRPEDVWREDTRAAEGRTVLAIDAVVASTCLFLPIRSCILWIMPLGAWSSFTALTLGVGSPWPGNEILFPSLLAFLLTFAYCGAHEKERNARQRWIAQHVCHQQQGVIQENSALAQGMQDLAEHFCNIVIKLDEDLRAFGVDQSHKEFFQLQMQGRSLADVIAAEDQERYSALMSQVTASRIPGCITVTLRRESGSLDATLLVVPIGVKTLKYLVGARVEHEVMLPCAGDETTPVIQQPTDSQFHHYSVSEFSAFSGQPMQIADFGSTEFKFNFCALSTEVIDCSAHFDRLFGYLFPPGSDCSHLFCRSANRDLWRQFQDGVNRLTALECGGISSLGSEAVITVQGVVFLEHHPVQYTATCSIALMRVDDAMRVDDDSLIGNDDGTWMVAHAVLTDVKVYFSLARPYSGSSKPHISRQIVSGAAAGLSGSSSRPLSL